MLKNFTTDSTSLSEEYPAKSLSLIFKEHWHFYICYISDNLLSNLVEAI